MTEPVLTPITQALNDGVLTRAELKALMRRSDRPALIHLALWLMLLGATGTLVWASLGTLWVWPAMFVHGIVVVHFFSIQHECVHYTVFRTRWLNDLVGYICGLVIILPNRFFRYEHCDHHTYTQLTGEDPEQIPMPKTLGEYLWYISSVPYWRAKFQELGRHAAGRLTEVERGFIPKEEHHTIFLEARLMLAFYASILLACVVFDWWAPLWFWLIPLFLGEPVMRFIRMTEHVGRPAIRDMKENTRSNMVSAPMRFLCWNMNYHAEHHYASSVPYHALPRLHDKLKGYVHVEEEGYLGAHREILRHLFGGGSEGRRA
ncbi:fatty acid desaturase family protein [Thetidibacter halocola]|uniref:Fatty acid desaturase family protein n=1 Tax=Thetidibacter halocola TaxID=2827239 RepID=A0A8J8B755_9RHOB|nr:fatty acid desaturase family protein [Thetidibacter halocola]MBS0124067.1 fatty acid desaturase family protein [Thetidibacter halocola]